MISSSSKNGNPRSVAPMLPYEVCINTKRHRRAEHVTHDRPQYALQLEDEILVLALQTMPADEVRELRKVSLLLEHFTT